MDLIDIGGIIIVIAAMVFGLSKLKKKNKEEPKK